MNAESGEGAAWSVASDSRRANFWKGRRSESMDARNPTHRKGATERDVYQAKGGKCSLTVCTFIKLLSCIAPSDAFSIIRVFKQRLDELVVGGEGKIHKTFQVSFNLDILGFYNPEGEARAPLTKYLTAVWWSLLHITYYNIYSYLESILFFLKNKKRLTNIWCWTFELATWKSDVRPGLAGAKGACADSRVGTALWDGSSEQAQAQAKLGVRL